MENVSERVEGTAGGEYQDYDLVAALPNGRPCEDRKVNVQKFEDAFYASANPNLRTVRPPKLPKEPE